MSAPKTARNQQIMFLSNMGVSMAQLARHFGISHSRVREILGRYIK